MRKERKKQLVLMMEDEFGEFGCEGHARRNPSEWARGCAGAVGVILLYTANVTNEKILRKI